jgi:hypothetical protein
MFVAVVKMLILMIIFAVIADVVAMPVVFYLGGFFSLVNAIGELHNAENAFPVHTSRDWP